MIEVLHRRHGKVFVRVSGHTFTLCDTYVRLACDTCVAALDAFDAELGRWVCQNCSSRYHAPPRWAACVRWSLAEEWLEALFTMDNMNALDAAYASLVLRDEFNGLVKRA